MTVTRIVLVRHGEAQAHLDQVIGGRTGCRGLSDLGRRQATALRDRLAHTGELADADFLYSSTLPRAAETAEIIAPALGGLPVVQREDLREFDPGVGDGMTYQEHDELFPQVDMWSPYTNRVPDAETWATFGARVGAALHSLADEHAGRTVVVACHGGVIEHSFTVFHGRGMGGWLGGVRVRNCGITEWEHAETPDEPWVKARTWTLVRHNDASHVPDR